MRRWAIGMVAAPLLGTLSAQAQPPEASAAPPAASMTAPPATTSALAGAGAVSDAQARFRRALELHEEGNLDAARTELRRAYETAPNYKVLFNLAQVEFELLDYPAALATFEKYLAEGGDRVPKERRAQVQSDIEKLRGRLATIEIAVNVAGARVAVDDVAVGTTPLTRPVRVSAGRRRVAVSRAGFGTETRLVDVAGGDRATLNFELADASHTAAPSPATAPALPGAPSATTPPPAETLAAQLDAGSSRSVPWVGWVATAVLAAGAGVTGGLALQRSQKLSDDRTRFGIERSELDRLQSEATTLALASDICAGAAAFAGVLSLYFTLSSNGGDRKVEQGRSLRVSPSLGFVSVEGSF